jgi:hypothetical protein
MGSIPYRMYDMHYLYVKTNRGVYWGLVDKKSNSTAFELRNCLGCTGSRQVIPATLYEVSAAKSASISSQAGHRIPLAYFGCNFAWSLLPKGVIAGTGKHRCTEALQTLPPGSPLPIIAACTHLLKGLKCPG